ncbi:MAG TPA: hypothetical protein VMZ31_03685 [Phycisphaerae bacterium]|nr:hypothetical protein [Phycisphaerae bacterium]
MKPPGGHAEGGWKQCLILIVVLASLYAGLQNGQWAPVSDADLYAAIARSIYTGHGFTFNGAPVGRVPPGWPLFLAGAMSISTSYWFLNLAQMSLFLGTAALYYYIVRRFTSPSRAFVIVFVVGILSRFFHLTFMLHSEGLFGLTSALAILLALQVSEGRPVGWRIPLLIVLSAVAVAVRWAGVLLPVVVGGALLSGGGKISFRLRCASFLALILVALGSFLLVRHALKRAWFVPSPPSAAETVGVLTEETGETEYFVPIRTIGLGGGVDRYVRNVAQAGGWFSGLLFEPAQLGRSYRPLALAVDAFGWVLIALFIAGSLPLWQQRRWLLLGVLLYCGALCARWPYPAPRYLLSFAPLLLLGVWLGIDRLGAAQGALRWHKIRRALVVALFAAIVAVNLPMYLIDAWMIHAEDFYGTYYAGQSKPLIVIADYLRQHNVSDGEVGVSPRYVNLNIDRGNTFGRRGFYFLMNRVFRHVPEGVCRERPNAALLEWASRWGVKYYVYRPPTVPWRLWHFRTPWLQEKMTGAPVPPPTAYFELYELRDDGAVQVELPAVNARVDRVPGV